MIMYYLIVELFFTSICASNCNDPEQNLCFVWVSFFLIFVFELTRKLKTLPTHLNWKINRYIPQIYINKYAIGKVIQINCLIA